MPRHHHILSTASNLLGIALFIITGLHICGAAEKTIADEIDWVAASCLSTSCLLSYVAIRRDPDLSRSERWADRIFLIGLACPVLAVLPLAALKL